MSRTTRLLTAVLAVALLALTGCGGDDDDPSDAGSGPGGSETAAGELPDGMVLVDTDLGTVGRPEGWQPAPGDASVGQEASFLITDDAGETVGQMDVILNTVTPGTQADAVAAAVDSARMPSLPTLRQTSRDFADVPGAESAFVTESTYTTVDTAEPAKSLDQVAVTEDGDYMLVRITALETAYDAELFRSVVGTMEITEGAGS